MSQGTCGSGAVELLCLAWPDCDSACGEGGTVLQVATSGNKVLQTPTGCSRRAPTTC